MRTLVIFPLHDVLRSVRDERLSVKVRAAEFGAVLLPRMQSGSLRDLGEVEQLVERLGTAILQPTIAWVRRQDPQAGERLAEFVHEVKRRMTPIRTEIAGSSCPQRLRR